MLHGTTRLSCNVNLFRATQGKGLMPDGTTRLSCNGKQLFHFMGCSTFAEYAVVAEISIAKVNRIKNFCSKHVSD